MNQHVTLTPSQLAFHQAAKERAMRKIEAARRNGQAAVTKPIDQTVRAPEAEEDHAEPDIIIPDDFETHATVRVSWFGEYCTYPPEEPETAKHRTMAEIATEWLKLFPGVTMGEIKGAERARRIVFPRQVIMHAIKKERPDLSFPQVARWMGGRDHTTGLHAVNKIQAMIDNGTYQAEFDSWQALYGRKVRAA